MPTKTRDVMSTSVEVVHENDTALDIAQRLADNDLGAVPVCGADERLKGMVTDRDLVTKVVAERRDPADVRAGDLGQGDSETVTIGADDSIDDARRTMVEHGVRRLPVIDGDRLVGIISQADLAEVDNAQSGAVHEELASQPPNN